jgi:hypothetical protein
MSNVDAYDITFNDANITTKAPLETRTLDAYFITWRVKPHKNKQFPIGKTYSVKNNVYEIENWTIR